MEVPALYYYSHQVEAWVLYTSHWTLDKLSLEYLCKKVHVVLLFAIIWSAVLTEHQDTGQVLKAMSVLVEGKLELTG